MCASECTCVHVYARVHMGVYMCLWVCTCVLGVYMCVGCVHVFMGVYMCLWVCTCLWVCWVCIDVYL